MNYFNINSDTMKKINLVVVLDYIRRRAPISRKELADEVGLTSASITNIVNRLNAEGYLIETGSGESAGGRKPIMLELNSQARYAVGVELNVSQITCLITDFKAKKIMKKTTDTLIHEGKDKVIERLIDLIRKTIVASGVPYEKIIGIGLASAGPYDHEKGIMVNPPNFHGWLNVPIKDILQDALNIPTYFEKETVAAALAEYWFGSASEVKSLFVISIMDIGIGGGVMIDGHVYHGFCDGAGDLGHMMIDIEGPACSCGNYGCLETLSSGEAILKNVKSEIKRGENSIVLSYADSLEDITTDMIVKASIAGDPLCTRIIKNSGKYMGIAISNIINVYSPEVIVLGGSIPDACPCYVEEAIVYARRRTYPLYNKDVKILPATFGCEQGAIGGIGLVFQEFFKKLDQ